MSYNVLHEYNLADHKQEIRQIITAAYGGGFNAATSALDLLVSLCGETHTDPANVTLQYVMLAFRAAFQGDCEVAHGTKDLLPEGHTLYEWWKGVLAMHAMHHMFSLGAMDLGDLGVDLPEGMSGMLLGPFGPGEMPDLGSLFGQTPPDPESDEPNDPRLDVFGDFLNDLE